MRVITQVVIVPILKKGADCEAVLAAVTGLEAALKGAGIRVKVDAGGEKTPGWKFNYYEMKGVPVRVEVRVMASAPALYSGSCLAVAGQVKCDFAPCKCPSTHPLPHRPLSRAPVHEWGCEHFAYAGQCILTPADSSAYAPHTRFTCRWAPGTWRPAPALPPGGTRWGRRASRWAYRWRGRHLYCTYGSCWTTSKATCWPR